MTTARPRGVIGILIVAAFFDVVDEQIKLRFVERVRRVVNIGHIGCVDLKDTEANIVAFAFIDLPASTANPLFADFGDRLVSSFECF